MFRETLVIKLDMCLLPGRISNLQKRNALVSARDLLT